MRALIVAALLLGASAAASAQTISTDCHRSRGSISCQTTVAPSYSREALILHVPPPADTEASAARRAKWIAFCQPREATDRYGVVHLLYAHDGCEFGRTE